MHTSCSPERSSEHSYNEPHTPIFEVQKAVVEADPEKLRSILDNLLGNAVKFTPGGDRKSVV